MTNPKRGGDNEKNSESWMDSIPLDIIKSIIFCLDLNDINKISQVNKKFRDLCQDNYYWKQKCANDLGLKQDENNYLTVYKKQYQLKRSTIPLDVSMYVVYYLDIPHGKWTILSSYLARDINEIWDSLLYIYVTNNDNISKIISNIIENIKHDIQKQITSCLKYQKKSDDAEMWEKNLDNNKLLLKNIETPKSDFFKYITSERYRYIRIELKPLHKTYTNQICL